MFEQKQIDPSQLSDEQILQFVQNNPELKAQYDLYQNSSKVLQNFNKSNKPLTDKDYIGLKDIKTFLDPEGGILIEPSPNFAIKGFDKKTNEKIFINILTHSIIDEPEQKDMINLQNQQGIRVPMSVGSIKEDHDVKGEICKVVDVIVNPNVAESMNKDTMVKEFFCGLVQNYFLEKFKLQLADNFTFPKMKYKGKSVEYQRVKGSKAPKITVMNQDNFNADDQVNESKIKKNQQEIFEQQMFDQLNLQNQNAKVSEPEWEIILIYQDQSREIYDGEYEIQKVSQLLFEIKMPLIVTGMAVDLQVGKEFFHLRNGRIYELALKFPIDIQRDSIRASFQQDDRILQILANTVIYTNRTSMDISDADVFSEQRTHKDMNIEFENNLLFDIV